MPARATGDRIYGPAFRYTTPGRRINHVCWSQPVASDCAAPGSRLQRLQWETWCGRDVGSISLWLGRADGCSERLLLVLGDNLLVSDDARSQTTDGSSNSSRALTAALCVPYVLKQYLPGDDTSVVGLTPDEKPLQVSGRLVFYNIFIDFITVCKHRFIGVTLLVYLSQHFELSGKCTAFKRLLLQQLYDSGYSRDVTMKLYFRAWN